MRAHGKEKDGALAWGGRRGTAGSGGAGEGREAWPEMAAWWWVVAVEEARRLGLEVGEEGCTNGGRGGVCLGLVIPCREYDIRKTPHT